MKIIKKNAKAQTVIEPAAAQKIKSIPEASGTPTTKIVVIRQPAATRPPTVSIELVEPAAKQVFVAGSFNNWQPDLTPLLPVDDGRWKGSLQLDPGRHEYLFVVDGQWRPDPNAAETVENPFGGRNSVITVSV